MKVLQDFFLLLPICSFFHCSLCLLSSLVSPICFRLLAAAAVSKILTSRPLCSCPKHVCSRHLPHNLSHQWLQWGYFLYCRDGWGWHYQKPVRQAKRNLTSSCVAATTSWEQNATVPWGTKLQALEGKQQWQGGESAEDKALKYVLVESTWSNIVHGKTSWDLVHWTGVNCCLNHPEWFEWYWLK